MKQAHEMHEMEAGLFTYLLFSGIFIFGLYVVYSFVPFGTWLKAQISGLRITLLELIDMKVCRVAPSPIVRSLIMAARAQVEIDMDVLKAHSLAGGNVEKVVKGMIKARKRDRQLSLKEACELDLAHRETTKGR